MARSSSRRSSPDVRRGRESPDARAVFAPSRWKSVSPGQCSSHGLLSCWPRLTRGEQPPSPPLRPSPSRCRPPGRGVRVRVGRQALSGRPHVGQSLDLERAQRDLVVVAFRQVLQRDAPLRIPVLDRPAAAAGGIGELAASAARRPRSGNTRRARVRRRVCPGGRIARLVAWAN